MKKTLAAALTAAVLVGSASTTSAAISNPFTDVPAGHWAYQSIEKLRVAGVIDGYTDEYGRPNSLFRGDRNITRYEVAQMVARALAKNPQGANKAELDRLVAEFRDELDALGVRVDNLEKYADKVVWNGELRYRYWNEKDDIKGGGSEKNTKNRLELRLMPTAEVNDHWKLKARFDARINMREDSGDSWGGDFHMRTAYAQGVYDKLTIQLGKFDFFTQVDSGMVMDDFLSGAAFIYGDKFKVALMAGRYSSDGAFDDPASYVGGELSYDTGKFYVGAGYHHFRSDDFRAVGIIDPKAYKDTNNADVWSIGARYNFDNGLKIRGAYAQNTKAKGDYKRSWTAGLGYKGANRNQAGTWGISADYRYVSELVSLAPTYDAWLTTVSKKGVEVAADWAPMQNTYIKLAYFWGKRLGSNEKNKTFLGRVSFFF